MKIKTPKFLPPDMQEIYEINEAKKKEKSKEKTVRINDQ